MPVPTVTGSSSLRHVGDNNAIIDISAVPNGSWMIVSTMSAVSSTTVTAPGTWTTLAPAEVSGSRINHIFGKIKESSDGNSVTFTQSTTSTTAYGIVWGTGASSMTGWIFGSTRVRSLSGEPSGSRHTNIAPGITTSGVDYLALAISHEATNAFDQPNEVTSVTPSATWTQRLYLQQVGLNDRIETIWVGSRDMPTAGSTGDVSIAYVSPQDNNGWAMQIAIPYSAPAPVTTPQVVGASTQYVSGASTSGFTISRPSGVANNDYIIVALRSQGTATVAPSSPGFTRLGAAFVLNDSGTRTHGFYGKPVTDAPNEPASYTFSFTTGTSRVVAAAFIVRGVDITDPIAGFYNSYTGSSITGGRETAPYSVAAVPALSLFMGSSEFSSPNDHVPLTTPAGFTNFINLPSSTNLGVSRTYAWVGSKEETSSPTSTAHITWTTPAGPAAEMITLRGSTATPPDLTGPGFTSANGNGDPVQVYYTDAGGARTPADLNPMRRGFNTVADMLAKPGFTWAHRGGSVSYPEHSLYAYTQAVARGYGVLEVSLARTSDGVWFGLHDQTTDRSSGGTYGNASSQTWAQIQAQQIVIGPQGAPQPYMSLNQLVSIYGNTHVFVLDPKYALGTYRTEFLNLANTLLGPTKAIIKYSGPGSGAAGLSTAAQAMGFETWGFFYAGDASAAQGGNGALQTWGPSWTIIGMEYGASQAIWDECIALGRPIVGHIAPNQAAYDMAIAKGASGVQVSGVGVVAPVSWWT